MSVYIDSAEISYRGMRMNHMIADSADELLVMADRIGMARKHIQKPGLADEHFDVCLAMKARALKLGAIEVTSRELVKKIWAKRTPVGVR